MRSTIAGTTIAMSAVSWKWIPSHSALSAA
jgi:hypothetical protein